MGEDASWSVCNQRMQKFNDLVQKQDSTPNARFRPLARIDVVDVDSELKSGAATLGGDFSNTLEQKALEA